MDISTICQRQVVTIDAGASLREAAILMRDRHVGALVVTDSGDTPEVLGIVTDRDLAIEVLAREPDGCCEMRIGDIASESLVAVTETATVHEAVDAMKQHGVRRLLVTDDGQDLIGFVSADDLLKAIASELGGLAAALKSGIARERIERAAIVATEPQAVLPPGTRLI
ncbi:MAG TPA: CBS domain-containing protein [Ramlibacter sp.]|nr:CBS domain-containing protein [Ramlibacter sp.]